MLYSLPRGSKVLIISVSVVLRLRLIVDEPYIPDRWYLMRVTLIALLNPL